MPKRLGTAAFDDTENGINDAQWRGAGEQTVKWFSDERFINCKSMYRVSLDDPQIT